MHCQFFFINCLMPLNACDILAYVFVFTYRIYIVLCKKMFDKLDLAFAMDCTGSMASQINEAKQNIIRIVDAILASGASGVRLALVNYRDHPPQDTSYVTDVTDFTSVQRMKEALDRTSANGGGDTPEAIADALYKVNALSWDRDSIKVCVVIADAPPHGLDEACGDKFPNGCPEGHDPMKIANDLAEKGVSIHVVACEPSLIRWEDFFMALCKMSGGLYIPLTNSAHLADAIVGATEEEMSLSSLRKEIEEIIKEEIKKGELDEEYIAHVIFNDLKGRKTKHMKINGGTLPKVTARAKRFARFDNLNDVKKKFQISTLRREDVSNGAVMFTVEEKELDMLQLQRMIQKVLMMKGIH